MDSLTERLAALTPAQRTLFERRRKQQGLLSSAIDPESTPAPATTGAAEHKRAMRFSLFFFSDDGSTQGRGKYQLLLESAKFADQHGFTAIWTPERHFQDFGGLYPNPSVLGAALATITSRIQIRAGSIALPLHHTIRAAEEWSVVDNLSDGRVGIACASGWHPADFVLSPAHYAERKTIMLDQIQTIQRLWAGDSVMFPSVNGEDVPIKILPRPIQPQLPIWITSSGTLETIEAAGAIGAHILTTAGVSQQAFEDLKQRIQVYRDARARHGHDPQAGIVSLMVHTFLGADEALVKQQVREPLRAYLATYLSQFEELTPEAHRIQISPAEKELMLDAVFERYFDRSALLGTPRKCTAFVDRLQMIGVDELACLVDFGLDATSVLAGLPYLHELQTWYDPAANRQATPSDTSLSQ